MRQWWFGVLLAAIVSWSVTGEAADDKVRFFVAESYHRDYSSSQRMNEGFMKALLELGYLEDQQQADQYMTSDYVESARAILRRAWMDTKRKSSKPEMEEAAIRITEEVKAFQPDLIFLGDDNAANYIGQQFLDTETPIVFWGINHTPVKYGLVDSPERPGHNVTGVVEVAYYEDCLTLLKQLAPSVKTFALISDGSETGRSNYKEVEALARDGKLPLAHVETVATDDFALWKQKVLELQSRVDAFFIVQYATLKDEQGNHVPEEAVARWYLTNVRIPEAARSRRGVTHGYLCAADILWAQQGYDAVAIAHDLLTNAKPPATYPTVVPRRGPLLVNRHRAQMLGIAVTPEMGVEEFIDEAEALKAGAPRTP